MNRKYLVYAHSDTGHKRYYAQGKCEYPYWTTDKDCAYRFETYAMALDFIALGPGEMLIEKAFEITK